MDDMRSIGKVIAEAEDNYYWDGLTVIQTVLVVDVRGESVEESLSKASSSLRRRGWVSSAREDGSWEQMESSKWNDVLVTFSDTSFVLESGELGSQVIKAIEGARALPGSEAFVVLSAQRTDG
ncbi:hypothetical protein [Nonomuraea sp. KM88]|uniref:hypothetical protein n=1 Tax=Nonomuraea sp. KM88 TaxID=3457427 RepID=UPI003FCE0EC5